MTEQPLIDGQALDGVLEQAGMALEPEQRPGQQACSAAGAALGQGMTGDKSFRKLEVEVGYAHGWGVVSQGRR